MMYLASLPLSDLFIIDLNIFDDRFGFFPLSRFVYHCLPCFECQNFDDDEDHNDVIIIMVHGTEGEDEYGEYDEINQNAMQSIHC